MLLTVLALASTAIQPAVPARAESTIPALLSDQDYPAAAIRNEEQGTVAFRLDISASGAVTGCAITSPSGSKLLDETTCRIMTERARFIPARDGAGRTVHDSFNGRIRWVLPPPPTGSPPLRTATRGISNVWEVTAARRQRSCRSELRFESGEKVHLDRCIALDQKFVAAAAAYLEARPEEVLTVRLENRWLLDPVLPFDPAPAHRGDILARAEGDYRLNDDLTVQNCVEGRFSARFNWRPAPCFRKGFAGQVPPATRSLRMEVQWVVSRGPDTERPAQLPSFVSADGKHVVPVALRPGDGRQAGANPLGESPHQP
nr:energy transducer TonB [uncultured Sphingomonas sp.]